MSIQSEITRISNKRDASFTAVANKGVTVPAGSTIDDLPDLIAQITGGFTITDVSNTTGTTAQITGSNGISTNHTIHLEFSDSSDTDIDIYYTDSLIGSMITAYSPASWTYSSKEVILAQLDNVTWFEKQDIPLNTQLVNYTTLIADTAINNSGGIETQQWYYTTDFIEIDPTYRYAYRAGWWTYFAFYDAQQSPIRTFALYNYANQDQNNNNIGYGHISVSSTPQTTKYVRLCGPGDNSDNISLIRVAYE